MAHPVIGSHVELVTGGQVSVLGVRLLALPPTVDR